MVPSLINLLHMQAKNGKAEAAKQTLEKIETEVE